MGVRGQGRGEEVGLVHACRFFFFPHHEFTFVHKEHHTEIPGLGAQVLECGAL